MDEFKKSKLYFMKRKALLKIGFKFGLIGSYSDTFIKKLRNVYFGGIPASILLLSRRHCNHRCYDRVILAACALDDIDFSIVDASIDHIKYHPSTIKEVQYLKEHGLEDQINPNYAEHSFIVYKDGNKEYVIDTTDGLIFDKKLYWLIESPKVRKINDKAATQAFPDYIDIKNATAERDKYILPTLLPMLEKQILDDEDNIFYKDRILEEIEVFKETIGYDGICEEIRQDKRSKGWNV